MSSPRILFAGLYHETHTFLSDKTDLSKFEVTLGEKILGKKGDDSPTAGFLEEAERFGWTVLPTVDARATPSGTVTDEAFAWYLRTFKERALPLVEGGIDGIFIVMHGAMATETIEDPEGDLLALARSLPGAADVPLFGVLDLHGNISSRCCSLADGLVAYRENPHTDSKLTAMRAAGFLSRALREHKRPKMHWCRVPIVWAPPGTGTANDPMLSLTLMAQRIEEKDPSTWCVNIMAGFSFADTSDTGVTLSTISEGDPLKAEAHLREVAELAWRLRAKGNVTYPSATEVLGSLPANATGPILLVEPADNIGAGAYGDGTGILRAVLARPSGPALVAINDPAAVKAAADASTGQTLSLRIGGHGWEMDEGPVALEVTLVSRSNGDFDLEDPNSHLASMAGRHIKMGPCAVVRHGEVTILLTSRKTPPFDLGQYRSQGIEPTAFRIIGVKAAVAHRRAYDKITKASYFVDTPGPCSSDLSTFRYKRLLRPVYPLDSSATLTLVHA